MLFKKLLKELDLAFFPEMKANQEKCYTFKEKTLALIMVLRHAKNINHLPALSLQDNFQRLPDRVLCCIRNLVAFLKIKNMETHVKTFQRQQNNLRNLTR